MYVVHGFCVDQTAVLIHTTAPAQCNMYVPDGGYLVVWHVRSPNLRVKLICGLVVCGSHCRGCHVISHMQQLLHPLLQSHSHNLVSRRHPTPSDQAAASSQADLNLGLHAPGSHTSNDAGRNQHGQDQQGYAIVAATILSQLVDHMAAEVRLV